MTEEEHVEEMLMLVVDYVLDTMKMDSPNPKPRINVYKKVAAEINRMARVMEIETRVTD